MPTQRIRELETLLGKIRIAGGILLNYDMWERWGAAHASPEERAKMDAEFSVASRDHGAAKIALETLVIATRADAPAELATWAELHDLCLAAFLDDCTARGESEGTAAFVARGERAQWAEVRAGARSFVDENHYYVTMNAERYRRLFGLDPQTLLHVD